jgi:hypothetical protein
VNVKPRVILTLACLHCGKAIQRPRWLHLQNIARGRSGPYCSKSCSATREPRNKVIPPNPARFWAKVNKSAGCWEWSGARQTSGYGNAVYGGRLYRAHRLAWELENGPIPSGMLILHGCDNPPCVRPSS